MNIYADSLTSCDTITRNSAMHLPTTRLSRLALSIGPSNSWVRVVYPGHCQNVSYGMTLCNLYKAHVEVKLQVSLPAKLGPCKVPRLLLSVYVEREGFSHRRPKNIVVTEKYRHA